jgi:hypothetical protein
MSIPYQEFRWVAWLAVLVVVIASALLLLGFFDKEHWDTLVLGMFNILVSGAKTP